MGLGKDMGREDWGNITLFAYLRRTVGSLDDEVRGRLWERLFRESGLSAPGRYEYSYDSSDARSRSVDSLSLRIRQ